ncbi:uncharacterized protein F5891DRAFT_983513 [Suillus fuscotomentosus]|uniref:Uncharacterized protein n=1 Tax=Suillus fuscotomentosus TaxID=1912939 RepID=A0AAD4HG33_9AGAM|nr:uncharacterized protein F5891DRAFT_983513 [Suillus fuscotomentosus]KAG1896325.1 hypothetical protein F5891DRAFT_983513 [Suillus fuscotomentosus]
MRGITPGPLKCRKTLGLNTRFDRMLAQVHVSNSYSLDPKTRRKRAHSSGSSSVSSYDLPKTPGPVDAYSHEDRLGSDFSVSKMNNRASNPTKSPSVYRKGSKVWLQTKALPMWLAIKWPKQVQKVFNAVICIAMQEQPSNPAWLSQGRCDVARDWPGTPFDMVAKHSDGYTRLTVLGTNIDPSSVSFAPRWLQRRRRRTSPYLGH